MNLFSSHRMKYPITVFHVILMAGVSLVFSVSAGAGSLSDDPDKTVKIGLLIQDNKSVAAKQGAEIAVRRANQNSGPDGLSFELVVRSMEGPWGTGSKQAVDLIFNEKVWALVGSHDGRNAHLVEQAATKAIVPFVSAWSGDPGLSQAFVPWFFNCIPNDFQQAEAIFNEIFINRKLTGVAIIFGNEYDPNMALSNFLKKIRLEQKKDPVQFRLRDYAGKIPELASLIARSDAECIVLFCNPADALKVLEQIRQLKKRVPLFSSHYILNENEFTDQELRMLEDNILFALPEWSDVIYRPFANEYKDTYGRSPGMAATYAFDSMCLVIEAIRNAGTADREQIQKSLEKIVYKGVTGTISFDEMGNREGPYIISILQNGIPALADK
ncbi:MAG: ABC transporter substrate-binding protein [Bacteroidota bacterium]